MKDYLKRDLNVGDQIIYISNEYRQFENGTIKDFNNGLVTVKTCDGCIRKYYSNNLIKIINETKIVHN